MTIEQLSARYDASPQTLRQLADGGRSGTRWRRRLTGEDRVPSSHVVRVEPSFELALVAEAEDAHDARGHLKAGASCTHLAQRADVLVVAEHVLFGEHESESGDPLRNRNSSARPR